MTLIHPSEFKKTGRSPNPLNYRQQRDRIDSLSLQRTRLCFRGQSPACLCCDAEKMELDWWIER